MSFFSQSYYSVIARGGLRGWIITPNYNTPEAISLQEDDISGFNQQPIMLDRNQVHKVAHLARLDITPEEEIQFTTQLSSILEYFEQLKELDTKNVPPTTRAIEVSNVTRPDITQSYTNRQVLLQEAPEQEGDFFRVPQILTTDED
jgi:aspartyl-tRNA(Asn)/glutamyl-tRNA(Gln) amidotransferase subunit C